MSSQFLEEIKVGRPRSCSSWMLLEGKNVRACVTQEKSDVGYLIQLDNTLGMGSLNEIAWLECAHYFIPACLVTQHTCFTVAEGA
eukprot:1193480-Rhodomonas_salina.1